MERRASISAVSPVWHTRVEVEAREERRIGTAAKRGRERARPQRHAAEQAGLGLAAVGEICVDCTSASEGRTRFQGITSRGERRVDLMRSNEARFSLSHHY